MAFIWFLDDASDNSFVLTKLHLVASFEVHVCFWKRNGKEICQADVKLCVLANKHLIKKFSILHTQLLSQVSQHFLCFVKFSRFSHNTNEERKTLLAVYKIFLLRVTAQLPSDRRVFTWKLMKIEFAASEEKISSKLKRQLLLVFFRVLCELVWIASRIFSFAKNVKKSSRIGPKFYYWHISQRNLEDENVIKPNRSRAE